MSKELVESLGNSVCKKRILRKFITILHSSNSLARFNLIDTTQGKIMRKSTIDGSALALSFVRWILGSIFLIPAFFKSLSIGEVAFAGDNFVGEYQSNWMPVWLLWMPGFLVPYLEFLECGLVCLGFRVKKSSTVLGSIIVIVTYCHLFKEMFFDMSGDIFLLLVLVVFVFMVPGVKDLLSVDKMIG